jgi:hypothetical protein
MEDKNNIQNFGEFKENLNISDVSSSFSDIKKLLIDLGFHHSWGYWISNQNKQHRINIETSKNRIYLDMTKRGNYFDLNTDRITINKKDINIDDIKNQLVQYFN